MLNQKRGSILVAVLFLVITVGGFAAALFQLTLPEHRASSESFDNTLAFRAADSGVGYYLAQLNLDENYFALNPAPHVAIPVGDGIFALESALPYESENGMEWALVIVGHYDRGDYRLGAAFGNRLLEFPGGLVVAGTGDPDDLVLELGPATMVTEYDPEDGPPLMPGTDPGNVDVRVNGGASLSFFATVEGNVTATGSVSLGMAANITGTLTENAPETPIDDRLVPIANGLLDSSKQGNDNDLLASIFGDQWNPVDGDENYGDLILDGGEYVVPSGVFRFRRLELNGGATVTFDTSLGPSKIIYVGGQDHNDLSVKDDSSLVVDPGGTSNGLLTILSPDSDFEVTGQSVFGQAVGDPYNAGYSQIISAGGDGSYDRIKVHQDSAVFARMYAPNHKLEMTWNSAWYGSAVVRTALIMGDQTVFAADRGEQGRTLNPDFEVFARWRDGFPGLSP